jgi:succinate-semialdehyde dehydrogenase/glutarate-semialdehyde dehydrogenase
VNIANADDVGSIIARAREAQKGWGALPYRKRAVCLKKAARYLGDHVDEIVETIHRENGKLRIDALAAEILPALMAIGYYLKEGKKFCAPGKIHGGNILMFNKRSRMVHEAWGVVGIISPWNYPFAIPFSEVVMALLAGNAVLLKTASVTQGVGRCLAEVFEAAGLPPSVFNYLELKGSEAGKAFIGSPESPGVDKLFFTGSTATGRELMALSSRRLLPLVLELGGADAAIIRADADLDRAAGGILWAGFSNAGQSCGGAQRILVHCAVYDAFLRKICALVESLRPGETEDSDLGPMATVKQKETAEKQIAACVAMGARIAARSPVPADAEKYSPAVILSEVTADMPVMNEEIFGPVIAVMPVEDDEEALRIANSSAYGLSASVWSRNRREGRRIAERINAGAVMVNDHLMSHGLAETPWGGFGYSGLGRTHGAPGFAEMLKAKVIIDDCLPGVKKDIFWHPYSASVYRGFRSLTAFVAGPGLGIRLKNLPPLLKVFFRYWEK